MVARAEDIFLFESKRREKRVEEEEEFNHTFFKRNRTYSKGDSYENAGIIATAAIFKIVKERKEQAPNKQR